MAHPALLLPPLLLAFAPSSAPAPAPPQEAATREAAWSEVAARGLDATVTWSELDALLVARHSQSQEGRDALRHLVRARLLDRLAAESKLVVGEREVAARWSQLDAEIAGSGESTGLDAYLEEQGVDPTTFREFLRLSIVQETLARNALGIPEDREVPGDQQEMWLDQVIEQRGLALLPPPWPDDVAARCGDVTVRARDYVEFLRGQLDAERVRDACYQLLLARRVRARMPDLAPEALAAAVEAELGRRRAEVDQDPKYKGLPYEHVLGAQGLTLEGMRGDPVVVCAALATLWVDRAFGEEGLRKAYADERAWFDGLHGEARAVYALFLRAAVFQNPLNPRTFEEADAELSGLATRVDGLEDFQRLAAELSEDSGSRERQGLLGWVPRGDERVPAAIREAAFSDAGSERDSGRLVGPVRLAGGSALLWIGARRPAPGWDVMREAVHRELRRRFLDECLEREAVVTYLDP